MKVLEHQFTIPDGEDLRVDKFLAEQLPDVSRSQIKNLIEAGNVTLDDTLVEKAGAKARPGSIVRIDVPVDDSDGLVPENIPLDILYEDDQVIVINKPSG